MEIKEKILSLIPKKQEVREIKVPDLKQYLINGYEEIRQVKREKIQLENQLEEQKKNEQLYNGALVTLEEFRRRDEENNKEILKLRDKIRDKQKEIDDINSKLNTYKIRDKQKEIDDINSKLNTYKIRQHEYDKKEKEYSENIEKEIKIKIIENIKNRKGNLSKDTIINIINNT